MLPRLEANDPNEFRPEVLSVREREVLDLAVEGRTDEQIAQALDLSTSTVNSYWVRIRDKVGHLSRTEIVGMVLRHESGPRHADLIAEIARLRTSEGLAQNDLVRSRADLRAMRGDDWRLLALNRAPEAMFVCKPPHQVIYANFQAQHAFAVEPGELEGRPLWELTIPKDQETRREAAEAFFQPQRAATPRDRRGAALLRAPPRRHELSGPAHRRAFLRPWRPDVGRHRARSHAGRRRAPEDVT